MIVMIKRGRLFISELLDLSQKYTLILETPDLKNLTCWDKEEGFNSSEDDIKNMDESQLTC